MSICQNLTVEPDTVTKSGASKFQCKKLFKVAPKEGRYKIWEVKCLKDGQRAFLKNLDIKGGKRPTGFPITNLFVCSDYKIKCILRLNLLDI